MFTIKINHCTISFQINMFFFLLVCPHRDALESISTQHTSELDRARDAARQEALAELNTRLADAEHRAKVKVAEAEQRVLELQEELDQKYQV